MQLSVTFSLSKISFSLFYVLREFIFYFFFFRMATGYALIFIQGTVVCMCTMSQTMNISIRRAINLLNEKRNRDQKLRLGKESFSSLTSRVRHTYSSKCSIFISLTLVFYKNVVWSHRASYVILSRHSINRLFHIKINTCHI